jgi:hypothetical protein
MPGVTLPQARAELQNIEEKLAHDFPDTNKNINPISFSTTTASRARRLR